MKKEAGFTLIEVIVVLMLTGIVAAAAGIGIVKGIEGYTLAKETTQLSQKMQIALERIRREMIQIKTVTAPPTASSIKFTISPSGDRGIGLSGDTVKISVGSTDWGNGDTLVGGVDSFTLAFYRADGSTWVYGTDDDQALSTIGIDLALDHSIDGVAPLEMSAYVNPRNTGNPLAPFSYGSGGTPSTTTSTSSSTTTTSTSTTTTSTTSTSTTTTSTTTSTTTTTTLPTPQFWEYNCDTTDPSTVAAGNISSTLELVSTSLNSVAINTSKSKSGTSGANNWKFDSTGDYAWLYIDRPSRVRFHLDADTNGDGRQLAVYANGKLLETFRADKDAKTSDDWNCDTGRFTGYADMNNVKIELKRISSSNGNHYVDDVHIDCEP